MKKVSKKKSEAEILEYSDSWIFILLLTTLVILTESVKNYTFNIGRVSLTFSLFLLPFAYFITNIITKKYGYQTAIKSISISAICLVLFVMFVDLITGNNLSFNGVYGEFCGYVVSSFVNLTIYYFLLNNTNMSLLLVFLNFIFVLLVNHFVYMLLLLNTLTFDNFWLSYFCSILIQGFICLALTFIDKYIKRGL